MKTEETKPVEKTENDEPATSKKLKIGVRKLDKIETTNNRQWGLIYTS